MIVLTQEPYKFIGTGILKQGNVRTKGMFLTSILSNLLQSQPLDCVIKVAD